MSNHTLSSDDTDLIARARRKADAAPHPQGGVASLLRALAGRLEAALAGRLEAALAARPLPPGEAPVPPARVEEMRRLRDDLHGCTSLTRSETAVNDLLAALDHADRSRLYAEAVLADCLADDGRFDEGVRQGVARALAGIEGEAKPLAEMATYPAANMARHLRGLADRIKDRCGDPPLLPHLAAAALLGRYRRALAEIAAMTTLPTSEAAFAKLGRMVALARAALEEES